MVRGRGGDRTATTCAPAVRPSSPPPPSPWRRRSLPERPRGEAEGSRDIPHRHSGTRWGRHEPHSKS
eukprot:557307-Pyramimonas_sp.AAC.1